MINSEGKSEQGEYREGEKVGEWIERNSGWIKVGSYTNGNKNGKWVEN